MTDTTTNSKFVYSVITKYVWPNPLWCLYKASGRWCNWTLVFYMHCNRTVDLCLSYIYSSSSFCSHLKQRHNHTSFSVGSRMSRDIYTKSYNIILLEPAGRISLREYYYKKKHIYNTWVITYHSQYWLYKAITKTKLCSYVV